MLNLKVVDFLKNEIQFVHAFVVTFKAEFQAAWLASSIDKAEILQNSIPNTSELGTTCNVLRTTFGRIMTVCSLCQHAHAI